MNRYEPWIQSPSVTKFDGEFSCLLKRENKKKKKKEQCSHCPTCLSPVPKQLLASINWGFWPLCYAAGRRTVNLRESSKRN